MPPGYRTVKDVYLPNVMSRKNDEIEMPMKQKSEESHQPGKCFAKSRRSIQSKKYYFRFLDLTVTKKKKKSFSKFKYLAVTKCEEISLTLCYSKVFEPPVIIY